MTNIEHKLIELGFVKDNEIYYRKHNLTIILDIFHGRIYFNYAGGIGGRLDDTHASEFKKDIHYEETLLTNDLNAAISTLVYLTELPNKWSEYHE